MIEKKQTVQDRGIAIALSVLMILSVVAVGAAAITPAAAQTVDQADRSAEATEVQPGDTVNVTVDVTLESADSFQIDEGFDPAFADVEIIDDDDASFSTTSDANDRAVARYGTLGDDPRQQATLVYQVTIPDDAEAGDSFEISSNADSDVQLGSTVLTVPSDVGSRTVPDSALSGETVEVTVDVSLNQAQSFTIDEGFDSALDAEIADDDDASFSTTETDRLVARYGTLGDDPRQDATLVYNVTIPDDAEAGDTFEISSNEDSDVQLGSDVIEVVEDREVDMNVNFSQQGIGVIGGGQAPAVIATDVDSDGQEAALVVTYEDNGDLVIAGLTTGTYDGENVQVGVQDAGGFPGQHTAHIIPVSDLSSDYAPGDTVSEETANAVQDNEAAPVYDWRNLNFNDQEYDQEVGEITLDTASLRDGSGDDTLYQVDVHFFDSTSGIGDFAGSSPVISGQQSDVTIDLQDTEGNPITIDRGESETLIAMIHVVDDPSVEEGDQFPPGTFPALTSSFNGDIVPAVSEPATVRATEEPEMTVDLGQQGVGLQGQAPAVYATNVDSGGEEAAVVVTYEDNGDLVIAGLTTGTYDGETVQVPLGTSDAALAGFPGNHTAHIIPTDGLSGDYAPGDTVSAETAGNVIDNAQAPVYDWNVILSDQEFSENTSEITLDLGLVADGMGDDTLYTVDIHPTDDQGQLIGSEYVGTTGALSGESDEVTIDLKDSNDNQITLEPGDEVEYIPMIHIVDDPSVEEGDDTVPGTFPALTTSVNGQVLPAINQSATISVVAGPQDPLPGQDNVSQDLNGDGLYEDVNGDGQFSISDVQLFFQERDSDVVQDNPEFFNFDEGDEVDVSVSDVQALFQLFQSQ